MPAFTAFLLAVWFTWPSLLTLVPAGYDWIGSAHSITFCGAVLLLDRLARKRPTLRPATGAAAGALPAMAGALAFAYISHSPAATAAFIADLARFDVPAHAAAAALTLHWRIAALLTAGIGGTFYGGLGALLVGWRRLWHAWATRDPST